jgi:hypothetical protein
VIGTFDAGPSRVPASASLRVRSYRALSRLRRPSNGRGRLSRAWAVVSGSSNERRTGAMGVVEPRRRENGIAAGDRTARSPSRLATAQRPPEFWIAPGTVGSRREKPAPSRAVRRRPIRIATHKWCARVPEALAAALWRLWMGLGLAAPAPGGAWRHELGGNSGTAGVFPARGPRRPHRAGRRCRPGGPRPYALPRPRHPRPKRSRRLPARPGVAPRRRRRRRRRSGV